MANIENSFSVELVDSLKRLKLTGILDTLSIRIEESTTNKLPYLDFFSLLVQDEILRKDQNRFQNRLKKSKINSNKTIERFDFSFNPKINASAVRELMTLNFMHKNTCVLLIGPCGTGKSHLAQAIGFKAIQQGFDVIFTAHDKLHYEFQKFKAMGCLESKLKKYSRVPLLIIDDFGLKPFKSGQDEDFHRIISDRYENVSTIITSNLSFKEWQHIFINKLLGSATVDRIRHGADEILLEGRSYRTNKK